MKLGWLVLLGASGLLLGGCTSSRQAVNAGQSGTFFANQLVFDTAQSDFQQHFAESSELSAAMQSVARNITKNFFNDMTTEHTKVPDGLNSELSNLLIGRMKSETSFNTVMQQTQQEGQYRVSYQIFGLDYLDLFRKVSQDLTQTVMSNRDLATTPQAIMDLMVEKLRTSIPEMQVSQTPVETQLYFGIDNGKWYLLPHQEEAIRNMYFAFLTGQKNEGTLTQELAASVQKINEQLEITEGSEEEEPVTQQ